jgi:pyridoxal phosphate-dependent aminotransferase EpsN
VTEHRIYLSIPHMGGGERAFVDEAFATNWMSSVGPNVDGFEREVADYLGGGVITLAVSSGTAALHLLLREIGVGPGDRVAVSTLTFAGSVFPIVYLGATPVFIDSEKISGNIDASLVREYLAAAAKSGKLPKALIGVHLYGQHCDIDAIALACAEYEVPFVEDAAESLGATYKNRHTGTTSGLAILSYNGNKIITTTGGGMVVARDPKAIARMRKWATQAREQSVEYLHREIGYNYRMSNVLAGIGRGQLLVLDERVRGRRAIAERYSRAFAGVPGLSLQAEAPWGVHSRWLSVLMIDAAEHAVTPAALVTALEARNIEVRPVWRPMHTQPVFADAPVVGGSVAEFLYRTGLCLPSSSSLTLADQDRVIGSLLEALANPTPIG